VKRVVILQPLFFPWRGVFEQIRLAKLYAHLDDVAVPQGRSFLSRVQIKTSQGMKWLSVPIRRGSGLIRDTLTDDTQNWRQQHLRTLEQAYAHAPFREGMLELVRGIYELPTSSLAEINIQAIERITRFLGLECEFVRSSHFPSASRSTQRLVDLSTALGAQAYLTGHGALNYLEPEPFEQNGVQVEIMSYRRTPYPQLFGEFEPHVSILDLIANAGPGAGAYLDSACEPWRGNERDREIPTGS